MSIANPESAELAMPFAQLRQEVSRELKRWSDPAESNTMLERARSDASAQPDGAHGALQRPPFRVVLSATFTLEPVEPALAFWLRELGYSGQIEFAPYNQVLQQLLDPHSALSGGADLNVIAVRFEDLLRFRGDAGAEDEQAQAQRLLRTGDELVQAIRGFAARAATPTIVWVGPASERAMARHGALFEALSQQLSALCQELGHFSWLTPGDVQRYPADAVYDARRDAIGHIPYTPDYFTALATALARRLYALKAPPIKVIAVDCDNTLWKGVVGEEGAHGISLPPGKLALQRELIRQQQLGAILCLVSKNAEEDVLSVFREREDMLLKLEHIVSQRVNWVSKSENIASLAAELNVGIDSFLFIDDNPVECAEMKAAHPQVTTLLLPEDERVESFLDNLWAFDRLKVTEEDQKRTLMYQQNRQRAELEQRTQDIGEFLRTLDLSIDIAPPVGEQVARVAQLTQRTNQFNFTTVRRNEAEVAQLAQHGLECLRAEVRDRFGDYGLVGVMIFAAEQGVLRVDTLLLSCRVLGRGVEHSMLAHLGELAKQRGIPEVEAPFAPTKKNQPALNFLESIPFARKEARGDGTTVYRLDSQNLSGLRYQPGADAKEQLDLARTGGSKSKASDAATFAPTFDRSRALQRFSCELTSVARIQEAILESTRIARPTLEVAFVAPRSELEQALAEMWQRLLNVDPIGVHDDFSALGGTSLMAAELFVQIEERFGVKLPMTTILEASTISLLEQQLLSPQAGRGETLKRLRRGSQGGRNLFLVHDGDGETLLYLNLARRLPQELTVWGLEPLSSHGSPMLHTRMAELARFYVDQIRKVQPDGPYYLGGMCAGGTIAFEMALQLEQAGQEVGLVALIDSADAKAARIMGKESQTRLRRFVQSVLHRERETHDAQGDQLAAEAALESAQVRPPATPRLHTAARKIGNVVQYEARRIGQSALDTLRFAVLQRALDKQAHVPQWVTKLSVRSIYERLERDYTPRGKLHGPAVLYRATWRDAPDKPLSEVFRDPLLGWQKRLTRPLSLCDVPGGHSSMLQEPQVAAMAEDLSVRLVKGAQTAVRHRDSSPSRAPGRAHEGQLAEA